MTPEERHEANVRESRDRTAFGGLRKWWAMIRYGWKCHSASLVAGGVSRDLLAFGLQEEADAWFALCKRLMDREPGALDEFNRLTKQ